ncbi:FAD-dependent oxidoreductase [Streptomyces paludis]|uniref:FAD-dependent oxidoreductase n=1 Tax=Streptomyces paludis TaxID=2282738 RepID=A0A345HY38_9ACTN|nr:FAD-dependent oxidoreductase [Streptomyces paludis]AXG81612.1 FAD-dependent oxidoreductase [Streptomyces paludis]
MTRWDAETAVVGLGAWGAAALWRLASRGVDVVGFERFTPGHTLGPPHVGSRVLRLAGPGHAGLVPLARRALELWPELEDSGRRSPFVASGSLLIGPGDGPLAGGTLRAARAHGVPVRTFTAAALRFRFPRHTGVPAHHIGVWEPSARILRTERAVRTAVALAEETGARVHADSRVTAVEPVPGGVHLHTPQRSVKVRQAVLTAGAWLPALLPELPLETVRMPVTWFRPYEPDGDFDLEHLPFFMRELEDGRVLWGSGAEGGRDVLLGLDDTAVAAKPTDPEDTDHSVAPDDWADLSRLVPAKVPGLRPLPARVAVGSRTRTPDGRFLLGRPGDDPRLIVAGGDNAHGFGYAPAVGEALADLVQGITPPAPLDFLHPDRFA